MEEDDGFVDIDLINTSEKLRTTSPADSIRHDSRDTMNLDQDQTSPFSKNSFSTMTPDHSKDRLSFRHSFHNIAASSRQDTMDIERPSKRFSKSKAASVTGEAQPSFSNQLQSRLMAAGQKRKIPITFGEISDDDLEPTLPTSFRTPRGLEHLNGLTSSENTMTGAETLRKKQRSNTTSLTSSENKWQAQSSSPPSSFIITPSESSFGRSTSVSTTLGPSSPEPWPEQSETSPPSNQFSKRVNFSTSRKGHKSLLAVGNEKVSRRRTPTPIQLPIVSTRLTSPPSDLNDLTATLNDVPEILTTLHTKSNDLIRTLAHRVNSLEDDNKKLNAENTRLRHYNDENFQDVVVQMNRMFSDVECRFNEKMQELIDSNDEVVMQRNPVAGRAHGGPKLNKPNKEPSVFMGMLAEKGQSAAAIGATGFGGGSNMGGPNKAHNSFYGM